MKRRGFTTLLSGTVVAWPLAAHAQQGPMRRIGVLVGPAEDDPESKERLVGFRQQLESLGWSEGRNVHIDYRFVAGKIDRLQVLAKELVALQPDVILAQGTANTAAVQRVSRGIPIVFVTVSDPIGSSFVANLARPGGNLTGFLMYEASITGKWLGMLKEIAPHLTRVGLLISPTTAYDFFLQAATAAAASLAIQLLPSRVENATDIERVIVSFARVANGGLLLPRDNTTIIHRDLVIALAARHQLPSGLLAPFFRRVRRSHVLRNRPDRYVSECGVLCRPDPARRQARRPSGAGADQV